MPRRSTRARKPVSEKPPLNMEIVSQMETLLRKKELSYEEKIELEDLELEYPEEAEKATELATMKTEEEDEEEDDWDYSSSDDEEEDDYLNDPEIKRFLGARKENKELLIQYKDEVVNSQIALIQRAPKAVKPWLSILISNGISTAKIRRYDPVGEIGKVILKTLFGDKYGYISIGARFDRIPENKNPSSRYHLIDCPGHWMVTYRRPTDDKWILYDANGSGTGYLPELEKYYKQNVEIACFRPHKTNYGTLSDNIFMTKTGRCASWSIFVLMCLIDNDADYENIHKYLNFVGTQSNMTRLLSTMIMGFWVRMQRWVDPIRHTAMQKFLMPKLVGTQESFKKIKPWKCKMQAELAHFAGVDPKKPKIVKDKAYTRNELYYQTAFGLRSVKSYQAPETIERFKKRFREQLQKASTINLGMMRAKHTTLKITFPQHPSFLPFISREGSSTLSINVVHALLKDDNGNVKENPTWYDVFRWIEKNIRMDWLRKWQHVSDIVDMRKLFLLGQYDGIFYSGGIPDKTSHQKGTHADKRYALFLCVQPDYGEKYRNPENSVPILGSKPFPKKWDTTKDGRAGLQVDRNFNPTIHLQFQNIHYRVNYNGKWSQVNDENGVPVRDKYGDYQWKLSKLVQYPKISKSMWKYSNPINNVVKNYVSRIEQLCTIRIAEDTFTEEDLIRFKSIVQDYKRKPFEKLFKTKGTLSMIYSIKMDNPHGPPYEYIEIDGKQLKIKKGVRGFGLSIEPKGKFTAELKWDTYDGPHEKNAVLTFYGNETLKPVRQIVHDLTNDEPKKKVVKKAEVLYSKHEDDENLYDQNGLLYRDLKFRNDSYLLLVESQGEYDINRYSGSELDGRSATIDQVVEYIREEVGLFVLFVHFIDWLQINSSDKEKLLGNVPRIVLLKHYDSLNSSSRPTKRQRNKIMETFGKLKF